MDAARGVGPAQLHQPQQQQRNRHDQPVRQQQRVLPAAKGSSNGIYKQKASASGRAAGTTCTLKPDWLKRPSKKTTSSFSQHKQRIWLESLGFSECLDRNRLRCKFCKIDFDSKWDNVQGITTAHSISEFLKLALILLIMVPGSVEDECVFST
jgi:hypothetical protein